jgi:hypothetical protein
MRLGTKIQSNSRIQFASNQSKLVPRKLDLGPSGLGLTFYYWSNLFVLFFSNWDLSNYTASHITHGTVGMLSVSRGAPTWFCLHCSLSVLLECPLWVQMHPGDYVLIIFRSVLVGCWENIWLSIRLLITYLIIDWFVFYHIHNLPMY